jgi:polyisoprenoid-binding protein YceI
MKNLVFSAIIAVITMVSFAFTSMDIDKKAIKTDKSKITWKGYKMTGSHYGTIAIKSGLLEFDKDKLTGGEFVVDMSTITADDLSGESKGKLENHLKSDDFFGSAKFAESKLKFTSVKMIGKNSYRVTGDLTIKSTTKPVTFELGVYGNKANATLKVDRSAYDVRYGSASFFNDLQDKVIYDEFDLVVDLEF